jgi:alpha-glucosidase
MWHRSGGVDPGRDGCRIPLPWEGDAPPYGFSPAGAERGWLEPPDGWGGLTVAAQLQDETSMLSLYRAGLRARRTIAGAFTWIPTAEKALAFARGSRFACVVNFGPEPLPLPPGDVLIASAELEGGAVPQDTTVWIRQADHSEKVNGKEQDDEVQS